MLRNTPDHPVAFLDHPGILAFAHRGGAGDWPENTMPAFRHAVGLGYRYLETDVHATADGVVVAFHDDSLDRVTDRMGRIADLAWTEVSQARVGGQEPIPLLTELLEEFPETRINIDPKHGSVVEPLANALLATNAVERVCVGAFSDRRLARMRELLGPGLCTSAGPRATSRFRASTWGAPLGPVPYRCLQVPVRFGPIRVVDRRLVVEAHRRSLQVHVWTIDDPYEMGRLLDLGVDGLMTDRPELLREVLIERGLWV